MQTFNLQTHYKHSALQSNLSGKAITRLTGSILLGALVTFSLFVIMHKLVSHEPAEIIEQPPYVSINSVFKLEESPEIQRSRPEPPPEIIERPSTPPLVKADPSTNETFSDYAPPEVAVNDRINLGTMEMSDREVTPIFRVNPQYPSTQAQAGTEGFVSLQFDVSASGNVINIQVIDAEPKRVFNRAARQALRKWRYQPKIEAGIPVAMQGLQVRLDFTLDQ